MCYVFEIKKDISDISCLTINADGLEDFVAVPTDDECNSAYLMLKFKEIREKYEF